MDLTSLAVSINQYGFPVIACCGLGYIIFYIWTWATTIIKPVLSEASTVLIALIDRIRLLDHDGIRLTQKVNVVLMLREMKNDKNIDTTTSNK